MEERNELPFSAFDRLTMDDVHSGFLGQVQLVLDVIRAECDVMNTFSILIQKLGDGAVGTGGGEKFEVDVLQFKESGSDRLGIDVLNLVTVQPERGFQELNCGVQIADRNSNVIDLFKHRVRLA